VTETRDQVSYDARLTLLRMILDQSATAMAAWSGSGEVLEHNHAFARLVGLGEDGHTGTDLRGERLRTDDEERLVAAQEEALRTGKSSVELVLITPLGDRVPAHVELTAWRDEREAFYSGLFHPVPDVEASHLVGALEQAAVAISLEGRVTYWNRGAENLYGLPASEALGQPIGKVLPGHPLVALQELDQDPDLADLLAQGQSPARLSRPRGETLTVVRTAAPILGDDGAPVGVLDLARDEHEPPIPRARQDVDAALEAARELVAVVGRDCVLTQANPACLRYLRREHHEVVGHTVAEVLGQELFERTLRPLLDRCFQGEELHFEVVRHSEHLGRRRLLVSYYPIAVGSGHIREVAAIVRDVTTQHALAYQRAAFVQLLELLNSASSVQELMRGATTILRAATGCRAVAIRLRGDGAYRFVACKGLSPEFLAAEDDLRRDGNGKGPLECLCGSVIEGRLPPGIPGVTEAGSFWTGDASEVARTTDLGSIVAHLRGRCIETGMESLVLVPLRTREGTVGLLYVADKRKNMLDPETVSFLEEISGSLAVGLERLMAEAALRASEERYRSFMGAFQGIAYRGNMEFIPEFFHGAVEAITGYTEEDFRAGTPRWDQIIHPEDRSQALANVGRMISESGFSEERRYRIVRKDGEIRWVQEFIGNVPDPVTGKPVAVQGTIHDITERVRAGEQIEELAASLARERDVLQTVMENTQAQLAYLDPNLNFLLVNTAYERGCGHSREELLGRNHFDLFPNEENQAIFERVRDTGVAVRFSEKPFRFADQPERGVTYWDWILVPVKDSSGRVQGLVFSLMDVTDSVLARQRVEDLARQLERHASQLDATMEAIPDGLIVYGPQGEIVRVNDSAREMLGYPDEILRDPLFNRIEYLDVRGPEGFPMAPQETAPARALRGETVRSETVSIRMAGSPGRRWLSLSAAPIRDSEGRMAGAVMTMADITALREAQAHLQEANEELLVQAEELQTQAEELLSQREQLQDLALEIEDERARLRAVIDNAPEGIIVVDREGQIVLANPAAEHIYEVSLTENANLRHLPTLQNPDGTPISERGRPLMRSAIDGVTLRGFAARFVNPEGVARDLLINTAPIRTHGESITGAVAVVQDVTALREVERQRQALLERVQASQEELRRANEDLRREAQERTEAQRKLAESQRLLQRTFDGLRDAIFVVSAEGDIVLDCNPAASETFGYTREEMLGRTMCMLHVDDEAHARFCRLRDEAMCQSGFLMLPEFPMKRRDGTIFPSERMVTPLEDDEGRRLGYICSVRDVSERLKLEHMKSEFVASVSHELRSPLAAIMGYTEIVLDEGPGELTSLQRDFLQTVYDSSQRLEWLINDLLDVSRMETGRYTLRKQTIRLEDVINTSIDNVRPAAGERGIRLSLEVERPLPPLEADGRRLGQVLDNLLSNAIKFTSPGGRVVLAARAAADRVTVEVRDTGIGIPKADLSRVFERFYRAENATGEERGGTGLGLYIARGIVEAHGGTLVAESELGKGSTFRLTLPLVSSE
jgi:PAS domain S-box-containing protein